MNHIGRRVFLLVTTLLSKLDTRKLSKSSELHRLKRKHRCYDSLSHYISEDPRSIAQTTCSWYKVWGTSLAPAALANYLLLYIASIEPAVASIDPELPVLILQRIIEILRISYDKKYLENTMHAEILEFMAILIAVSADYLVSYATIKSILGLQAQKIDSLLCTIFDFSAGKELAWDSSGCLRTTLLPSLGEVSKALRRLFGQALKLGSPNAFAREFPIPGHITDLPWVCVLGRMSYLRNSNQCANVACRKLLFIAIRSGSRLTTCFCFRQQARPTKSPKSLFEVHGRLILYVRLLIGTHHTVARITRAQGFRDCQSAPWTHHAFPHKRFCKVWSLVAPVWPRSIEALDETRAAYESEKGLCKDKENGSSSWIDDNLYLKRLADEVGGENAMLELRKILEGFDVALKRIHS